MIDPHTLLGSWSQSKAGSLSVSQPNLNYVDVASVLCGVDSDHGSSTLFCPQHYRRVSAFSVQRAAHLCWKDVSTGEGGEVWV